MKVATLIILCCLASQLHAVEGETPYQISVQRLLDGYYRLQTLKFGEKGRQLSADEENERLRLHAKLVEESPMRAYMQELASDIEVLAGAEPPAPQDSALIEELKEFLALAAGMQDRAKTRAESTSLASTIRRLKLRRDREGMKKLALSR